MKSYFSFFFSVVSMTCLYGSTVLGADKTLVLYLTLMKDRVKTADQSQYKHNAELIGTKWTDGKYSKAIDINGKGNTDFVITKEAATLKIEGSD